MMIGSLEGKPELDIDEIKEFFIDKKVLQRRLKKLKKANLKPKNHDKNRKTKRKAERKARRKNR